MIASDQLSGRVQKTSAGYSYRRVPVARSPTRRLDALKEKHQMLLESMRKQFNMEVSVDTRETEHLGEESVKIAKKQVTSSRNCKPLSQGQRSEAQDANVTKRETKGSSEIQLDCYVKLIPLRSSPRRSAKSTKKEEEVLATEVVHLDVPNTSPQYKKMADVDQFSKLPNTSPGNPQRRVLVPRSATRKSGAQKEKQLSELKSTDSRETYKEVHREKSVKIDQKQIISSRSCKSTASGLRTEAQEINKTKRRNPKGAGKEEQVVSTNAMKQDMPNASAHYKRVAVADVQNASRGQIYRQWPTTVNSLKGTHHVKEKQTILKSMREQFNMKPPKNHQEEESDKLGSYNGKIFKILESMREQFNGEMPLNKDVERKETDGNITSEEDLPKHNSSLSGQKVHPRSKQESQSVTSISPNISVKISNKRNIIGDRKGGSSECPAVARKTSQTERRKRQCKETSVI